MGCYADPPAGSTSLESLASYNFTSWSLMSTKLCLQGCADRGLTWGAIRDGSQCFCGSAQKFSLGAGSWVSSSLCTTKCRGNASESCGYWNGATVFNVSGMGYGTQALSKPPGYIRVCSALGVSPVLTGSECYSGGNTSLTGTSFWDGNLTPQRCTASCYELGYPLASVWNANSTYNRYARKLTIVCMCGDTLKSDGALPASMCSGKFRVTRH